MLNDCVPNAKADIELDGYGSNDIYADEYGRIYIWLANGIYKCTSSSKNYAIKITGGVATTVEVPDAYGVEIDGDDVAELSGSFWAYDPFTNILSLSGDCVLAGTNTVTNITVSVNADVKVSPARLMLSAGTLSGTVLDGDKTLTITNGTAELTGHVNCQVKVLGGSLKLYTPQAVAFSNETEQVHCVTVTNLTPNAALELEGLPDYYGISEIYADADGSVSLWLANGDYIFTAMPEGESPIPLKAHVADGHAYAGEIVPIGFTVNGNDVSYLSGEGWSYNDGSEYGVLTLSGLDHYNLFGTLTNKFLNISNSCTVAFSNVVFNSFNVAGLKGIVNIAGAYEVELVLSGENAVTAPTYGNIAGILVPVGASLVIGGDGALTVSGSENAAGIGGTKQTASGSIKINGGTVTATGGNCAAGIGGGFDAGCGSITIAGGTVTANGGVQGAGIGGGAFTVGTSVGGTYAGDIIIEGGEVAATGGNWAAGIGGGEQSSGGSVTVTGGRITAQGGVYGPAIGACGAKGTYGNVTISGGTIATVTNEYSFALGRGLDTVSMGAVTITGGSVDAASYNIKPAPSNGVNRAVSRVEVSGFTPYAAVAFDGLPDDYGKSDIYADASGSAYLWLPEDWTTTVTPQLMTLSSAKLRKASPGTSHTFFANGYSYTVEIPAGGGEAVAETGEPLQLITLTINDFEIYDGWLAIRVSASPATWMFGFAETLDIYASETLPIPDCDESKLDLSEMELTKENGDNAIFVVPLGEKADCRFFKVRSR